MQDEGAAAGDEAAGIAVMDALDAASQLPSHISAFGDDLGSKLQGVCAVLNDDEERTQTENMTSECASDPFLQFRSAAVVCWFVDHLAWVVLPPAAGRKRLHMLSVADRVDVQCERRALSCGYLFCCCRWWWPHGSPLWSFQDARFHIQP